MVPMRSARSLQEELSQVQDRFFSPGEVHQIIVMTHEQLTHGALTK